MAARWTLKQVQGDEFIVGLTRFNERGGYVENIANKVPSREKSRRPEPVQQVRLGFPSRNIRRQ
jgi:hypothetical protein